MRAAASLLVLVLLLLTGAAQGHEMRPALLELRETAPEVYDVVWKTPARGEVQLSLEVRLPSACRTLGEPIVIDAGAAFIRRWQVQCPGGLGGGEISVDGLAATMTEVLVRIQPADGKAGTFRLAPDGPSFVVEAEPSRWAVATTYLGLGIEHILFGFDHLLFVLALMLLVEGWRRLVATITAFTLAHSITLALATFELVTVRPALVEALIALSIVLIAVELVHRRRGVEGLTARWPWLVAFGFGLLHGLGFAGALRDIGLPQGDIPLALLLFNVGVELGQLTFVAVMLPLAWLLASDRLRPRWLGLAPAYVIGICAAYWLISRSLALLA
jgi:hydrogenase/urease accessory protein HupE